MANTVKFLNSLVSISQFNKGQATKIFDRLRTEHELIVLKNNQPSAIILSPQEYERLLELEENHNLFLEAAKRLTENEPQRTISMDEVMKRFSITDADLVEIEDIEIE